MSIGIIGLDERNAWATDKPVLFGRNKIADAGVVSGWSDTLAHSITGTDPLYPASRASDGKTHLLTQQLAITAGTKTYFHVDFGVAKTVDIAAYTNCNFNQASDPRVIVYAADNAAFSPIGVAIGGVNPTTPRIVSINSSHFTGTYRYFTFAFDFHAGTKLKLSAGEFYLGERMQMMRKPDLGYDPSARAGLSERFISNSGVETSFVLRKSQKIINANWQLKASEATAVDAWAKDVAGREFYYLENPTSAQHEFNIMRKADDTAHAMQTTGPFSNQFSIVANEQGPHYLDLEL